MIPPKEGDSVLMPEHQICLQDMIRACIAVNNLGAAKEKNTAQV